MSHFQVFLSHSSDDKPQVEEIARRLKKQGIEPWLDKWNLIPGEAWQPAIEMALEKCATCAVFVGPKGIGPWQNEEMRAAIARRVNGSRDPNSKPFRVIPVLLPGADRDERSRLPEFLTATTWVEFRKALDDTDALHRLCCGIRGIEPGAETGELVVGDICPYRGLETFQEEHSIFFFGREALTEWLVDALRPSLSTGKDSRFLAVIGPSGSGKSSLARAGLITALRRGALEQSETWPIAVFRPGPDPLESLAVALAGVGLCGRSPSEVGRFVSELHSNERTLHIATRLALETAPKRRCVLLIDQFEEIFTLAPSDQWQSDPSRYSLLRNLLYASKAMLGQTIVVLTLRADFLGKCATDLAGC